MLTTLSTQNDFWQRCDWILSMLEYWGVRRCYGLAPSRGLKLIVNNCQGSKVQLFLMACVESALTGSTCQTNSQARNGLELKQLSNWTILPTTWDNKEKRLPVNVKLSVWFSITFFQSYYNLRFNTNQESVIIMLNIPRSWSLGGNKNEFSVIACSRVKEAGYTVFYAQEKLIGNN